MIQARLDPRDILVMGTMPELGDSVAISSVPGKFMVTKLYQGNLNTYITLQCNPSGEEYPFSLNVEE